MIKMTAKEKVEKLIEQYTPHMYCYMGSGMLTNTYDEDIVSRNAKECVGYYISDMIEQWSNYHIINPTELVEKQLKYWLNVKKELNNLK